MNQPTSHPSNLGFAILSVMAILSVLSALSWSLIAPGALQQRAALTFECQLKAKAAAQRALRQAKTSIIDATAPCATAGDSDDPAASLICSSAQTCYRVDCRDGYKLIRAIGHACAQRKAVIQLGVIEKVGGVEFRWWQR
jgi:Tfp pilus assembly protein PilX